MKIWYQSTLDFAQHPNYGKALAAHFGKIAGSGTVVLLHGSVGNPGLIYPLRDRLTIVSHSVVDSSIIRALLASEKANSGAFIAASFSEPILPELGG